MIKIYTDAACIIPLGISGWAAVICYPDGRVDKLRGSKKCGKINRMELFAVIKALSTLEAQAQATIYTDSQYVARGSEQFKNPDNNADLWEQFDSLMANRFVRLWWVRSHNGNPGNEMADSLARGAVRKRAKDITDKLARKAARRLQKAGEF